MRLDEFLALHDRLVNDSARALINPPERRLKERDPPNGVERRNIRMGDPRPNTTSDAGIRWLVDNRRYEDAREKFKRKGKSIDAVVRAWAGGRSASEFHNVQATLVARLVSLSSERDVLTWMVRRIVELERSDKSIPLALTPRTAAKDACKRAGVLWMDISEIVDTQTWKQRRDGTTPDPWGD